MVGSSPRKSGDPSGYRRWKDLSSHASEDQEASRITVDFALCETSAVPVKHAAFHRAVFYN